MNLIQPLLIILLITCAWVYQSRMRSRVRDRLVAVGLAGVGIVLVASPELTNRAAHLLGVGRGADLVFYFSLIGIGFFMMLVFSKLRDIEAQITALTRQIAILQAESERKM